jgi:homoserine dehydrogenase
MSRKKIKIGLFGFGCVGYGLYEVLGKTPALGAEVRKICVKDREKQRPLPPEKFIYDRNEILNDEDINVVVELIDDAQAAYEIVTSALRKGKHVVSANKKMIAENFRELLQIQKQTGSSLLYEAACCASIPIIRNLEEYYDNDLLQSIEGIVNGSTNYILSRTISEKISFSEALDQAQKLGYAERDHFLDTSGLDAKYKLQILLAHAFGKITKPYEIFNLGIDRLSAADFNYAREKDLRIKLVASAYRTTNGELSCYVLPAFVSANEKLFGVDDVYNGVITRTSFADTQFFVGRGAGAYPTASAVLSDISALSYDYRYEYKKINEGETLAAPKKILLRVYCSHQTDLSESIRSRFLRVEESFCSGDSSYVTGILSLEKLIEISAKFAGRCSLISHGAAENTAENELKQEESLLEWV